MPVARAKVGCGQKKVGHGQKVGGEPVGPARRTLPICKPRLPGQAIVAYVPSAAVNKKTTGPSWHSCPKVVWQPAGPARKTLPVRESHLPGQAFVASVQRTRSPLRGIPRRPGSLPEASVAEDWGHQKGDNEKPICDASKRTISLATISREAIGGSRGEIASMSTSASQTFLVTASVFCLPGLPPAECFVKKMEEQPGVPAENVKLDGKRSCAGGPLVAAAAAVAPVWRALSGPIGSPYYSCCCQAYLMVSTTSMIGCAVLRVTGTGWLSRRFEGSVSAERQPGPGGRSFATPKSADREFVPRPNTARPDGGCLDKHDKCYNDHDPLQSWLKRLKHDESYWHDNTQSTLSRSSL